MLDNKKSRTITASSSTSKLTLASSKRNHKDVVNFIDELLDYKKLTITIYDEYNKEYVYEFDISNLEQALDEANDNF